MGTKETGETEETEDPGGPEETEGAGVGDRCKEGGYVVM